MKRPLDIASSGHRAQNQLAMNDPAPVLKDLHSASSRRESQNAFRRRKKGTVATRPHSSALGRTSGPVVRSDLAGAMVLVQRAAARATCRREERRQLGVGRLFVMMHEPRIASHVGGQYRRQPTLDPDWPLLHHGP